MTLTNIGPASPFDRIPDEILHQLLYYTMLRPSVFNPETFIQIRSRPVHVPPGPRIAMSITYPHANITARLTTFRSACQTEHAADWLAINTTNRRIRRVGKECFWSAKAVALRPTYPALVQKGDKRFIAIADMALALGRVEHIVIVNGVLVQPIAFLKIPKILRAFPRLRTCRMQFGQSLTGQDVLTNVEEKEWEKRKLLAREVPRALEQLLRGIGVPDGVRVGFLVYDSRVDFVRQLERDVYPILGVKARIIEKSRGMKEVE
jgi:hypothetical protein